MSDFDDPEMHALKRTLKPETWNQRVERAKEHAAIVAAIEEARAEGATEEEALRRYAPDWDRSTYHGRRRRFRAGGMVRLINQRPGKLPEKLSPEVRQVICSLRRLDPQVAVERIADVVEAQCGVRVSPTLIKRVLAAEGLNRPPGGGLREVPAAEELQFAGAMFLKLADVQVGYSAQMVQAIDTLRHAIPETEAHEFSPDGRDEQGRFTSAYNQARAKGEAEQGQAFRSIEELRKETDLSRRRLAVEQNETIKRKVQGLLALPLLTDTGKTIQLDDYRGGHGIAEFSGTRYTGDTLDRFLRDLKYLGAGIPMMEAHAKFWSAQESEGATAVGVYIDGVSKPLWTSHFTKAGKVSGAGRVMPCLDQVMVHTGMGTPIFWSTFSGHASLVTQTPAILKKVEALVGEGWTAGKLVVIDGEGSAAGLLKQFASGERHLVTILRENRVKPEEVEGLSGWESYRQGDEIAEGTAKLADSLDPKSPLTVRVVLIRRRGKGTYSVLATTAPREDYTATQLAEAYFSRWPRQELRFRTFNQGTRFKQVHGYGKRLVQNFTILSKLDKLRVQRERVQARLERQTETIRAAQQELTRTRRRLNAAKARRARQDGLLDTTIQARPKRSQIQERVEVTRSERERMAEAEAGIRTAETALSEAVAKAETLRKKLPALESEIATLESRKEIYQADTELDEIMTAFKLGFALLCEHAMRLFFPELRLSLNGFMRQVLSLPGTRIVEGRVDHIRIKASPNNDMMKAVEAACERVNAIGIVRNGRTIKLSVDWPQIARMHGSKRAR